MLHQGRVKGSSDSFCGEVVWGRAEAASCNQHPAATCRFPHRGHQTGAVVTNHALALVGDAQGRQLLRQPAGIAIGDVAEQQLGADAENLGAHSLTAPEWPQAAARPGEC